MIAEIVIRISEWPPIPCVLSLLIFIWGIWAAWGKDEMDGCIKYVIWLLIPVVWGAYWLTQNISFA